MTIKTKETRFRAYQLGNAGSSFSYFDGERFTLIEGRYNDTNKPNIEQEMRICRVSRIHTLHITSWDQDHCTHSELDTILNELAPTKIEYPGYAPHTDCGKKCLKLITDYKTQHKGQRRAVSVTPEYITSLDKAENYGYNNILYHPRYLDEECANNNSTVKQFRTGSFNVLSLGDVESSHLAAGLRRQRTVNKETDVMILAHHGADNGFTTKPFIRTVSPSVAIASADYANQFKHPKQEIRDLLHEHNIRLFTTKTGDIVVFSINGHRGHYRVVNLKAGSTAVSTSCDFYARKSRFLAQNLDTIRARTQKRNHGPR